MPSDAASAICRWLSDILHNIDLAESFMAGLDYEAFHRDRLRVYGVIRCLEIISEASRRLPDELKARYPSIEWKEMAAAGNIIGMSTRMLPSVASGAPSGLLFHRFMQSLREKSPGWNRCRGKIQRAVLRFRALGATDDS